MLPPPCLTVRPVLTRRWAVREFTLSWAALGLSKSWPTHDRVLSFINSRLVRMQKTSFCCGRVDSDLLDLTSDYWGYLKLRHHYSVESLTSWVMIHVTAAHFRTSTHLNRIVKIIFRMFLNLFSRWISYDFLWPPGLLKSSFCSGANIIPRSSPLGGSAFMNTNWNTQMPAQRRVLLTSCLSLSGTWHKPVNTFKVSRNSSWISAKVRNIVRLI